MLKIMTDEKGNMTGVMIKEGEEWKKYLAPVIKEENPVQSSSLKKLWMKIMRFRTLIKGDDKLIFKALKNNLAIDDFDAQNFAYLLIFSMYQAVKENIKDKNIANGMPAPEAEKAAIEPALEVTSNAITELSETLRVFVRRML